MHWYRRLGVKVSPSQRVWCCQLAEFILSGQTDPYPSLEETAVRYSLGNKVDKVKLDYWDKGIDTCDIPKDVLEEYTVQDVDLTYKVYLKQLEEFRKNPKLYKLFLLANQDLLILEEMEWNGLRYNEEICNHRSKEIEEQLQVIYSQLSCVYPDVPINFNSPDQLSAFLYGGNILEVVKEPDGFYKSGQKVGQIKFKNVEKVHTLPRLVEPLPKSALKKEGVFKTDEGTLRKLKGPAAKKYVSLLLEYSKLDKLNGTYYKGIPKLNKQMNWEPDILHGQFNQVVAATGRLSSSKPNLQNFAGDCQDIFITEFKE